MEVDNGNKSYSFYELSWDTDFFGVNCAKAVIHKPLILDEWNELKSNFKKYQFVSIENSNSEPINAQLIGKNTTAFLADVNTQFNKNLEGSYKMPSRITIHQALQPNEQITEIAEFNFSKFIEDPELAKRGGHHVYQQWLINSFGNFDKYFALSKNEKDIIDGVVLYSYSENTCVIELIAVAKNSARSGVGTNLFKSVEYEAHKYGCNEIKVGTQMRNILAINFYQKVGCRQVGCHQVYHLWNT